MKTNLIVFQVIKAIHTHRSCERTVIFTMLVLSISSAHYLSMCMHLCRTTEQREGKEDEHLQCLLQNM